VLLEVQRGQTLLQVDLWGEIYGFVVKLVYLFIHENKQGAVAIIQLLQLHVVIAEDIHVFCHFLVDFGQLEALF